MTEAALRIAACLAGMSLAGLVAATPAAASPTMGEASPPRCPVDEKLDVLALVYNDTAPERSLAMVAVRGAKPRLLSVGSRVAGRVIIAIRPHMLWLGPDNAPCWMPLSHEGDAPSYKANKKRKRGRGRNKRRR